MHRIYVFRFVSDFVPIMSVYTLLFATKHLSTLEISVLLAAWSVSALVFEVPSGVVADKFDRRLVLVAGQLLTAVALAIWIAEPNFWGYFIGFVLWGIGGALDSGTFEALVYDELVERDVANKYVDVLGRSEALSLIAMVVGSGFAAIFVSNGYLILLCASIASSIIAAIAAISLPKAAQREMVEDSKYFSLLARGLQSAAHTPKLARGIAIIAVAGSVTDLVSEYAPLFASDQTVAASGVAVIAAISVLIMAATSAWAARLPGASLPASIHIIFAGLLIVVATLLPMWPAVVAFNLAAVISNATYVIARANIQEHIETDIRATTTSVSGFIQELFNVIGLIAVGALADQFTRTTAFFLLGIAVIITGIAMLQRNKIGVKISTNH